VHSLTLNAQMALLASMVSVVPTMAHSDLSAVPLPHFFGLLISRLINLLLYISISIHPFNFYSIK